MSHVVARHSHKLMKSATIAGILYQGAQVAAIILTGGAAGIGLAYALQYGFYGLGLVLDLKLLGVSRDYELEADKLGVSTLGMPDTTRRATFASSTRWQPKKDTSMESAGSEPILRSINEW